MTATINTGFWVKIEGDKVVQVWDTEPPYQTEPGWKQAIEIKPDVVPNREYITDHYFDITAVPVEIIWNKAELDVESRKSGLVSKANFEFQQIVQAEIRKQTDEFPETQYDAEVVEAARIVFETARNAIVAATTHKAVDALL